MSKRGRKTGGRVGYFNGAIMALNSLEDHILALDEIKVKGEVCLARCDVILAIVALRDDYEMTAKQQKTFWAGKVAALDREKGKQEVNHG